MNASQFLIIFLLIANLLATFWFGLKDNSPPNSMQSQQVSDHELPDIVNAAVRQKIYQEFSKAFNARDYESLYDMFGPLAKAQLSKEEVRREFQKLVKYFNRVESGSFAYSELVNTKGNTNVYLLYYTVSFSDESELGRTGMLKITIGVQSGEYQIYGIRLNTQT